jgi:hypothetical protein
MSKKNSEKSQHKFGGYRRNSLKQKNRKLSKHRSAGRPKKLQFMMTKAMRAELLEFGYTADDIYIMSPQIAQQILELKSIGYTKEQILGLNSDIIESILKLNDL